MIFGRWSIRWTKHQYVYLQQNNIPLTPHNHGLGWSSRIITLIWNHCYDAWITRNQALHGHDQQTRQIARLHQAQYRIRALYGIKNKCSRFAQSHWFYSSPEEHFRQAPSPSHLENWIAVNEARILTHVHHHQNHHRTGQRSITDFLTPIVQSPPTIPQPPSTTTMSDRITNAPLTREPGGFADDGLRARR